MRRRNGGKKIRKLEGRPCKGEGIFGRERNMSVSSVRNIDEFIKRKVKKEEIREKMRARERRKNL